MAKLKTAREITASGANDPDRSDVRQPPYRFIDKRVGANAYSSNLLIPSATQGPDRENIPRLDFDFHRNVSAIGRRTLLSAGRRLYAGNDIVRGAITDIATFAVSIFEPQFNGHDIEWGKIAEDWLRDSEGWMDLRGPPFTRAVNLRNLIIAVLRDGDIGYILTEDDRGNGRIQWVASHRIGPWNVYAQSIVQGGLWDGARLIDGVIVDDYGAPMAYRVMGENPWETNIYTDISANSMGLCFLPEYPDQLRGNSTIGSGLFKWQDKQESDYMERLAQKAAAAVWLIETNPTGEIDPTRALVVAGTGTDNPGQSDLTANPDLNQNAKSLVQEVYGGGARYLKANTGSKLEAFSYNRPGSDTQNFQQRQAREALVGMGWSYDLAVDPSKIGGAALRFIIDRANRIIGALQDLVVMPTCKRIDGYRVAKAIKAGRLPASDDWWRWEYQGPSALTADAKYDSDIDLQENRAGFRTMRDITVKRGSGHWMDVQDQLIAEEKRLQEQCAAAGVDPERIALKTPNGSPSKDDDGDSEDESDSSQADK